MTTMQSALSASVNGAETAYRYDASSGRGVAVLPETGRQRLVIRFGDAGAGIPAPLYAPGPRPAAPVSP